MLEGNPDLYGPVWIATTVIVILFLTGTISQYLAHNGKDHYVYDFKLLSGGAGLIYGYTGVVPVGLWGVLKWYGSESANLLECLCLYGYSNLIWIPVALISWSPISRKIPSLCKTKKYPADDIYTQSLTSSSSLSALLPPSSSSYEIYTRFSVPLKLRPQRSFSSLSSRFTLALRSQLRCFSLRQRVPWVLRMGMVGMQETEIRRATC